MANRIGRFELLFWYVASILGAGVTAAIVAALTNTTVGPYPTALPEALILIAASIVMLRAALSRFHDIGWLGRALILMFIPLVNVLAFCGRKMLTARMDDQLVRLLSQTAKAASDAEKGPADVGDFMKILGDDAAAVTSAGIVFHF